MTQPDKTHTLSAYFNSNISFLKLTALWIYDDKTKTTKQYLQHFYNIVWFLYIFVAYQPAELLYVYYSFHDLSIFLRALRDIGNHVSLAYKAFNYFIVRKDLLKLMNTLQHGNYNYEDCGDFRPKLIVNEEKKEALKWTKYFLNFCNAICLSMFANGVFTFIFMSEKQYILKNGQRFYQQVQPVNTVSPFGSGTKLQFFVTFIYTMIALTFYAWMIVALDSLFITIMSCISSHLKILQGAFKTVRQRCIKRTNMGFIAKQEILHDPPVLQNCVEQEVIKCIKHLQTVLRFDTVQILYKIRQENDLFYLISN